MIITIIVIIRGEITMMLGFTKERRVRLDQGGSRHVDELLDSDCFLEIYCFE